MRSVNTMGSWPAGWPGTETANTGKHDIGVRDNQSPGCIWRPLPGLSGPVTQTVGHHASAYLTWIVPGIRHAHLGFQNNGSVFYVQRAFAGLV